MEARCGESETRGLPSNGGCRKRDDRTAVLPVDVLNRTACGVMPRTTQRYAGKRRVGLRCVTEICVWYFFNLPTPT